jgi:hypothetical protein
MQRTFYLIFFASKDSKQKFLNVLPIYIGKAIHASLYTLINEHAKSGFRGISLFMNQKQAKRFSPHIKCQGRRNIFYSGGGAIFRKKFTVDFD